MKIKFWGVRGSLPAPGGDTAKYGGNTPCIEVRPDDGSLLIFDAGTGIRRLGLWLLRNECPVRAHIFLTHAHWDHIQGFPFFDPAYYAGNELVIAGCPRAGKTLRDLLADQMETSHFPVDLSAMKAKIDFYDGLCDGAYEVRGARVESIRSNHPGTALGFKLEEKGKRFVYITDNELSSREAGALSFSEFAHFCQGAELLVHDATYTPQEMEQKKGWGHSSYDQTLELALKSGVKQLGLFHHYIERTDDEVDRIVDICKMEIEKRKSTLHCFATAEGLELIL